MENEVSGLEWLPICIFKWDKSKYDTSYWCQICSGSRRLKPSQGGWWLCSFLASRILTWFSRLPSLSYDPHKTYCSWIGIVVGICPARDLGLFGTIEVGVPFFADLTPLREGGSKCSRSHVAVRDQTACCLSSLGWTEDLRGSLLCCFLGIWGFFFSFFPSLFYFNLKK